MTVYVVEAGKYSSRGVVGVCGSIDAVRSEWPKYQWVLHPEAHEGAIYVAKNWPGSRRDPDDLIATRYEVK